MSFSNLTLGELKKGDEFLQVFVLDNFYDQIVPEAYESYEIEQALTYLINDSPNIYIKRTAAQLLCELTQLGLISNRYAALSVINGFLDLENEILVNFALKQLPVFENSLSKELEDKLTKLSDDDSGDVASQALFGLGCFCLKSTIKLGEIEEVILKINESEQLFAASKESIENRTDAEFYLRLIQFIKSIISGDSESVKQNIKGLEQNLIARAMYEMTLDSLQLDFAIFQLFNQLKNQFESMSQAVSWTDLKGEIENLMRVKQAVTEIHVTGTQNSSILDNLRESYFENISNQVISKYLSSEKQHLTALSSEKLPVDLLNYLNLLIKRIPISSGCPNENHSLLATLSTCFGPDTAINTYKAIVDKNASNEVLKAIEKLVKLNSTGPKLKAGSPQGNDIYNSLRKKVANGLDDYPLDKFNKFFEIVEETIRYTISSLVGSNKNDFLFLFSKLAGGSGQNAVEQDLQDDMIAFFKHSTIAKGMDHERTKFVDGGRVDIVYKTDLLTIPIELKKSLKSPTTESLTINYLAQAQTYTSGYDRLGLFVLLDLSDKKKRPSPDIRDWFNVHSLDVSSNMEVNHPDYVISVVIPGNRDLPFSKSKYV